MIDNYNEQVQKLRENLETNLLPLVTSDYVYLDFPMYFNIGDMLITKGAFELLSKSKYKCLYVSSSICINYSKITDGVTIILQGGGNFGDIYRGASEFRNSIITRFKNNKIIIFPQTIFYNDLNLLKEDSTVFATHSDLTIAVRDFSSYDIAKEYFKSNKILMLPDTAFAISSLPFLFNTKKNKMYFKRNDSEIGQILGNGEDLNIDTYDWKDILSNDFGFKIRLFILKFISFIRRRILKVNILGDLQNVYVIKVIHPYCIDRAVQYFSTYGFIYTTRLHAAILAMLMGLSLKVLDNSYGKNKHFFETWFPNFSEDIMI